MLHDIQPGQMILPHENTDGGALNFNAPPEDHRLIAAIVERGRLIALHVGVPPEHIDSFLLQMDLTVAHLNGRPMDLPRMLTAEPEDLMHDLSAIKVHIDRKTGKLPDYLRLRFQKV